MAKRKTAVRKTSVPVKKGPLLESFRITEDDKKKPTAPGRIHADEVLGRIHVVRRTITLHFEGEYNATLTYEAK